MSIVSPMRGEDLGAQKQFKFTRANAGGPRQLPVGTRWAARIIQFWR